MSSGHLLTAYWLGTQRDGVVTVDTTLTEEQLVTPRILGQAGCVATSELLRGAKQARRSEIGVVPGQTCLRYTSTFCNILGLRMSQSKLVAMRPIFPAGQQRCASLLSPRPTRTPVARGAHTDTALRGELECHPAAHCSMFLVVVVRRRTLPGAMHYVPGSHDNGALGQHAAHPICCVPW